MGDGFWQGEAVSWKLTRLVGPAERTCVCLGWRIFLTALACWCALWHLGWLEYGLSLTPQWAEGTDPKPGMGICAAILALHCVRNMEHVAEPTPGAAVLSSVTLVVFTLVCSLPGVLPFTKHNSKTFQRVSHVCLTLFPCLCWGREDAWLGLSRRYMVGTAADPCRTGRAAGAACFVSFMGLELKKLYLFKKEKQQEKNKKGFVFVSVLGHCRDRFGCLSFGKLRFRRAVGHRVRSALVALHICLSLGSRRWLRRCLGRSCCFCNCQWPVLSSVETSCLLTDRLEFCCLGTEVLLSFSRYRLSKRVLILKDLFLQPLTLSEGPLWSGAALPRSIPAKPQTLPGKGLIWREGEVTTRSPNCCFLVWGPQLAPSL